MGVRSAEFNIEATIQTEVRRCELRSVDRGGIECGIKSKSVNLGSGAPMGIVERLSLQSCTAGGIKWPNNV